MSEEYIDKFEVLLEPLNDVIQNFLAVQQIPFNQINGVIKLIFTLHGIVSGLTTPRQFNAFFDWFYPVNFGIINAIFRDFYGDIHVMTGMLNLLLEFVNNRSQRLKFDSTSLTGLIIFKEISKLLFQYNKILMNINVVKDPYIEK